MVRQLGLISSWTWKYWKLSPKKLMWNQHISWGRIPRAINLAVPGKGQNFKNKIKIAGTNEQQPPDDSTAHHSFYVHFEGSPPRLLRHESLGNCFGEMMMVIMLSTHD